MSHHPASLPSTSPAAMAGLDLEGAAPALLPLLLQESFSEIYLADAASLRLLHANQAACRNLQYSPLQLAGMTPLMLVQAGAKEALRQTLDALRAGSLAAASLDLRHVRQDGSSYPVELRLSTVMLEQGPCILLQGNNASPRLALADALQQSEARLQAIVSSIPGLVYQFVLGVDGGIAFPYVSEGCRALLGVDAAELQARPSLLTEMIVEEDRLPYREAMSASASEMSTWNWEGRLWIREWKDTKWVNLRAMPRSMPDGGIQWEGIMTNITASKLEQAQIQRSRAQLAELAAHVESLKENERTRIAREIHDDVGGNLTAIKMALSMLTRRLPPENPLLAEKAAYVNDLIDRTFDAVHRIAGDLRPGILDCGIVEALEWQAREFEKQSGLPCLFRSNASDIHLDAQQATAVFRICQEALNNISRHAGASQVEVELQGQPGSLRLRVSDDGRGIAEADRAKPHSFGLRGMVERAQALGGELSIRRGTGKGTVLALVLPL